MSEFVIKRKRRRPRTHIEETDVLDLGSTWVPALDPSNTPTNMIPEIAVLSQPTSSSVADPLRSESPSVGSVITIDKFLRQSVEKPLRTYRKMTPRVANSIGENVALPRKSAYMRNKAPRARRKRVETAAVEQQKRVKTKKRKNMTRLAESLSRAAVLAHGDPSDCLMDGHSRSRTRRPLLFEPFNKFSALTSRGKPLSSNIGVEHSSELQYFASGSHNLTCSPPVSFQKQSSCSGRSLRNACHHKKTRKGATRDGRVPLMFVPLQEAEAAYSLKFPRSTVSCSLKRRMKTVLAVASNNKPEATETAFHASSVQSITPDATERQRPNSFDNISSPVDALPGLSQSHFPNTHLSQVCGNNALVEASSSKPLKTFSSLLAAFMETARSASEHRTALVSSGQPAAGDVGKSI
ncbi:hypothetical protein F5I97DRAFT_1929195 [Phlebopus sp. FC_14]|nr:hypothetical protein F5I97DRAFT_1929195 [Phlebopus sp. FC_14]